jgi:2-polyprenyl-6-methoxyphenol hydroxylase-like FAD-dependent oxidoreductase
MKNTGISAGCQVLIVGAGPTGLVLAAELLRRGIATRVIDKGDGVVLETRALAIHARTAEVFDQMGLADRFLERGQIVNRIHFYTGGKSLLKLDLSRNGSRFGFMLDVPQDETERILRGHVSDLGGTIDQEVELVTLHQDRDRVGALVRDRTGAEQTITADYLVGCDGAHSSVRHALGLTFNGHPYPQDWLLADVKLGWARREDEMHAFFRPDGQPLICLPMRDHRWRLVIPQAGDRGRRAPMLEEIQQLVDQRAPEHVEVSDPTWLSNFQCHRRSANAYRRGRVLLAGDAVHVHTPAAGQGMNTGIMDAHNLGWKLALVASGEAPDWLLETYGEERAPVAAQVLSLTHTLVQLSTMTSRVQRTLRDTIVPSLAWMPAIQRRTARRLGQVHIAYRSSRLTRPDGARRELRPGDRVPDLEVMQNERRTSLYAALRQGVHVLLVAGNRVETVADFPDLQPYRNRLLVLASTDRSLPGHTGSVHLVRPDGYLAARGMRGVVSYLRPVFTQTVGVEVQDVEDGDPLGDAGHAGAAAGRHVDPLRHVR